MWAMEHFNTFVEGHDYTIITDHEALKYILTQRELSKKYTRIAIRLSNYNIKMLYSPGSENHAADLLSRRYDLLEIKNLHKGVKMEMIPVHPLASSSTIRKKQKYKSIGEYKVARVINKTSIPGRPKEYEYEVQ